MTQTLPYMEENCKFSVKYPDNPLTLSGCWQVNIFQADHTDITGLVLGMNASSAPLR